MVSKFRLDVAEQILQSVCMPEYTKRGRLSAGDIPLRLQSKQWGHFPRNIPPTEAKKIPKDGVKCAPNIKNAAKLLGSARNALWHYIFQNVLKCTIQ